MQSAHCNVLVSGPRGWGDGLPVTQAVQGGRLWLTSATRRRRVPSCRGGVQASCSELKARAKPKLQGELEQAKST